MEVEEKGGRLLQRNGMQDGWKVRKFGCGWERKSFVISPLNGEWYLSCNGMFVASFKTAGSCKRVGNRILREFGVMEETLHCKPNDHMKRDEGVASI